MRDSQTTTGTAAGVEAPAPGFAVPEPGVPAEPAEAGAMSFGSAAETLAAAEESVVWQRRAEARILAAAAAWADQHPVVEERPGMRTNPHPCQVGGDGTPLVAEFAHAELAVSLRVHPLACRHLIADALDLRHRLPDLWAVTVAELGVPAWVARRVASRTRALPAEDAGLIDQDLAPVAATLPPSRLFERLEALIILADAKTAENDREKNLRSRFVEFNDIDRAGLRGLYAKLDANDAVLGQARVQRLAELLRDREKGRLKAAGRPASELDSMDVLRSRALGLLVRDPEAAAIVLAGLANPDHPGPADRPEPDDPTAPGEPGPSGSAGRVVVHVHVAEAALRTGASGVARVEGHGPITLAQLRDLLGHARVTIRPVLDPRESAPVDSYEFTGDLREAVFTTSPSDCYPYAVSTTHRQDIDHIRPYQPDGPPGQTQLGNAGPMTRHHHRIKTHGDLAVRQPGPGIHVWRTPHHRYRLVDAAGTHDLDLDLGRALFDDNPHHQARAMLLIQRGHTTPS